MKAILTLAAILILPSIVFRPCSLHASKKPSTEEIIQRLKKSPSKLSNAVESRVQFTDHITSSDFQKVQYDALVVVFDASGSMRNPDNDHIILNAIKQLELVCFDFCQYDKLVILDGDGETMLEWQPQGQKLEETEVRSAIKSFERYAVDNGTPSRGFEHALSTLNEVERRCIFVLGDSINGVGVKKLARIVENAFDQSNTVFYALEIQDNENYRNRLKQLKRGYGFYAEYWKYVSTFTLICGESGGLYFIANFDEAN